MLKLYCLVDVLAAALYQSFFLTQIQTKTEKGNKARGLAYRHRFIFVRMFQPSSLLHI